jgi:truncated hemoglobin YjbI
MLTVKLHYLCRVNEKGRIKAMFDEFIKEGWRCFTAVLENFLSGLLFFWVWP